MEKKFFPDLTLQQVGNGWMVTPTNHTQGWCERSDIRVFQHFTDLCEFLHKHYKLDGSVIEVWGDS